MIDVTYWYLMKGLLIHWKHGEKYFKNCLLDYSEANNVSGWQWVAGSGADAAPYFRIFNPIIQGQKFDPEGEYVKKFIVVESKFSHSGQEKKLNREFDKPSFGKDTKDKQIERFSKLKV